jgi:hypothetical protein
MHKLHSSEHQSQWAHASFITGRFEYCGVDCLHLASLGQWSRNYGPFSSKQPKTIFCANFQPQLRGYENATATPVSRFHLLSIFYIGSSPNSTCSFSDYSTLLKQELLFHDSVHILHYFSLTTPFQPILPSFKRHFQADNDFPTNSINAASWSARPCNQ